MSPAARAASAVAISSWLAHGDPAVGFSVSKQAEANTIETTDNIKAKVADVMKRYPNLKFNVAYEQAGFVYDADVMPRWGGGYARCDVAMRYPVLKDSISAALTPALCKRPRAAAAAERARCKSSAARDSSA